MVTMQWLMEYGKVFGAYFLLMFVWPTLVFYKILRGKSLTFRFAFCTTVPIVLMDLVVLLLGQIHLLRPWIIYFLFYGSILWGLIQRYDKKSKAEEKLERILYGTYGVKQYLLKTRRRLGNKFKKEEEQNLKTLAEHWREYLVLAVLVVFGMIYFSYGAFCHYSYGIGDMYPHSAWIYQLMQGKPFAAGVYPQGMHAFIYVMCTLFGVRLYSVMLFLAGIQAGITLIAIYVFLKEMFKNRYAALFALALFLMVDLVTVDAIYSMARLQWTIPQEFGLFTIFLMATFFLRFIKERSVKGERESVFLLGLAFDVSVMVHFYDTIMGFFLCFALVPIFIFCYFNKNKIKLLLAVLGASLVISAVPMGLALLTGTPFQGSIGWAMDVMTGGNNKANGGGSGNVASKPENGSQAGAGAAANLSGNSVQVVGSEEKMEEGNSIGYGFTHFFPIVYEKALKTLYTEGRAGTILFFLLLIMGITIGGRILLWGKQRKEGPEDEGEVTIFAHYGCLLFGVLIFLCMYCAKFLGMLSLVEKGRVCILVQLLMVSACTIPLDLGLEIAGKFLPAKKMCLLELGVIFAVYAGTMATGTFRGYFYYDLTVYNGVILSTYAITGNLPENSYTVVSTTDNIYAVVPMGRHEEVINFVRNTQGGDYTLSTEYVFLMVEKNPIQYGQSHFFSGPQWLAQEKYDLIWSGLSSTCPRVLQSKISQDKVSMQAILLEGSRVAYTNIEHRVILESQLYNWCRRFENMYPGELHTYYEDNNMICYYFKQNPDCPYQLAIPR